MAFNEEEFSIYGKKFEDVEEVDGITKKPLSIENQIVTDEKGRRRFHGAFTGGFSAGHFNTVGSIEGWTPSTFVSTRATRGNAASQRKPEDFMDKEDLGEYGIAPRNIRTTKEFSDADSQAAGKSGERKRNLAWEHSELTSEADKLADLIRPVDDSVGAWMLKKMGWRPGKGVGPLVSKKGVENLPGNFKFAPDDVDFHTFDPKSDIHGLGYAGLDSGTLAAVLVKETALKSNKKQVKGIQGQAFGVGAFEEDDEELYVVDDLSKYDFALDEPSTSKTDNVQKMDDDFVPTKNLLPPRKFFAPPKIARDFVPTCPFGGKSSKGGKSEKRAPVTSVVERGAMLGDEHSVWNLVSDTDRRKIEEIRNSAPTARKSRFDRKTPPPAAPAEKKAVNLVKDEVLLVFPDNPAKQKRFDEFRSYLKRGLCMPQPLEASDWEWESEQDEFRRHLTDEFQEIYADARSRQKPLCQAPVAPALAFLMKSRFTKATIADDDEEEAGKGGREDEDKLKAVQLKMFGAMTREKHEWHPHRNLCKRFNVPNPYPESRVSGVPYLQKNASAKDSTASLSLLGDSFQSTSLELSRRRAEEEKQRKAEETKRKNEETSETNNVRSGKTEEAAPPEIIVEDQEKEKEEERPPMDLFRAIFAAEESEDESSSSDEEVRKEEEEKKTSEVDIVKRLTSFDRLERTAATFGPFPVQKEQVEIVEERVKTVEVDLLSYGPKLPTSDFADLDLGEMRKGGNKEEKSRNGGEKRGKKKHRKEKKKKSKSRSRRRSKS